MASDVCGPTHHVNDKGKGPATDAETPFTIPNEPPSPDICVICLDHLSEKAVALPCKHDQFDFPCLGTWVQQSQVCPLCKAEVKAISYDVGAEADQSKIFYLPAKDVPRQRSISDIHHRRARTQAFHPYNRGRGHRGSQRGWGERPVDSKGEDNALNVRRQVYQKKTYSAYVGTNRISRYRNITPKSFATSASLVNRAKMFIRRELQVFDFLGSSPAMSTIHNDRRAGNAEFLLEYTIGILKSIDLKGSTGQAEELLKDFLGRENARLFLHELEAWLRSPYERLSDWDKHVQYGDVVQVGENSRGSRSLARRP